MTRALAWHGYLAQMDDEGREKYGSTVPIRLRMFLATSILAPD